MTLQSRFVRDILPTVQKWARAQFGRADDVIAEAVALAWK